MLRGLLEPGKRRGAGGPEETAQRTRRLIVAVVVLLLAVAALSIAFTGGGAAGGISSCSSIILGQQRIECISSLANSTLNVTMCGYLPSPQNDECIVHIAAQKGAAADCSMISRGSAYYDQCEYQLANRTGDRSLCYNLTDNYTESSCLYSFAAKGGFSSIGLCGSMRNSTLAGDCRDVYYFKLAVSQRDQAQCLNLPGHYDSGALYAVVSSAQNQSLTNSSLLLYSNANITARDYCYYTLAAATGNRTICSQTSGTYADELCLSSFSSFYNQTGAGNTTSVCSSLPGYLISSCTYSIEESNAIVARNVTACLAIPDQQYSETCIINMAAHYNDSAYCTQLTNDTLKQICYSTS
ncbi:MAG: hypothetical protein KGH98_01165 [Candidatus Micrarchaeota archaeon]|nr:hypothetical protein [Candidatus Micrarchaeota archaeon]